MKFYTVDVSSISYPYVFSPCDEQAIKALAESIVKVGGLVEPLLVKQTGFETYELMCDELKFQAVLLAKKLAPRECEMVNCFVIDDEQTMDAALDQVGILESARCGESFSDTVDDECWLDLPDSEKQADMEAYPVDESDYISAPVQDDEPTHPPIGTPEFKQWVHEQVMLSPAVAEIKRQQEEVKRLCDEFYKEVTGKNRPQ